MGGVKHQLGLAEETTYGTVVTPNRWYEFVTEGLERRQVIGGRQGIRPGVRYGRGSTRRLVRSDAAGPIRFETATTGFGLLFKHMFGTVVSSQPDAVGAPTVWLHTFTPGPLAGKSLTLQKGVEDSAGVVRPFTYPGSKILSWDFAVGPDDVLGLTVSFDARSEETVTALATAALGSPKVFHYGQGTLKVAGVTVATVIGVPSFQGVNNYKTDRYFLGSTGLKSEPINRPFDTLSGRLDVEFANLADFYDRFRADTSVQVILEFVGDVIQSTFRQTLRITLADTRFEGETPKIGSTDLVAQNIPFSAWDPTSGAAVTLEYQTTDSSP